MPSAHIIQQIREEGENTAFRAKGLFVSHDRYSWMNWTLGLFALVGSLFSLGGPSFLPELSIRIYNLIGFLSTIAAIGGMYLASTYKFPFKTYAEKYLHIHKKLQRAFYDPNITDTAVECIIAELDLLHQQVPDDLDLLPFSNSAANEKIYVKKEMNIWWK